MKTLLPFVISIRASQMYKYLGVTLLIITLTFNFIVMPNDSIYLYTLGFLVVCFTPSILRRLHWFTAADIFQIIIPNLIVTTFYGLLSEACNMDFWYIILILINLLLYQGNQLWKVVVNIVVSLCCFLLLFFNDYQLPFIEPMHLGKGVIEATRLINFMLGLVMIVFMTLFFVPKIDIDRTKRKYLEETAKQKEQEAIHSIQELHASRERFIHVASHELRGPLMRLKGLLDNKELFLGDKNYDEMQQKQITEMEQVILDLILLSADEKDKGRYPYQIKGLAHYKDKAIWRAKREIINKEKDDEWNLEELESSVQEEGIFTRFVNFFFSKILNRW